MLKITINKEKEELFTIKIYINDRLVNTRTVEPREPFGVLEQLEIMLKCNSETVGLIK